MLIAYKKLLTLRTHNVAYHARKQAPSFPEAMMRMLAYPRQLLVTTSVV